jgi:acyl dehydratase
MASPRGLFFEQFETGMVIQTVGRTVTETDIVSFAGLSGDFNQIHTDAQYSANTPFGQRVAHGILGLSIASGLAVQTGFIEGTVLAFREINNWKFSRPIYIGDTIHVDLVVLETKAMPRLGGGIVSIKLTVINQEDKVAMSGSWKVLVAGQPEGT